MAIFVYMQIYMQFLTYIQESDKNKEPGLLRVLAYVNQKKQKLKNSLLRCLQGSHTRKDAAELCKGCRPDR